MLQTFSRAADEAAILNQNWGNAAITVAQERLHAAMARNDQPSIDHAVSVCRLLIAQRR